MSKKTIVKMNPEILKQLEEVLPRIVKEETILRLHKVIFKHY